MERDPHISKLIKEGGVVPAPEGFSRKVMDMIAREPENKVYKPLIGRWGRILIILFILTVLILSLIYSEPGGSLLDSGELFSKLDWQIPKLNLNLDFLREINLSTGIVSALVAMFLLVLSDAGLRWRKLI